MRSGIELSQSLRIFLPTFLHLPLQCVIPEDRDSVKQTNKQTKKKKKQDRKKRKSERHATANRDNY